MRSGGREGEREMDERGKGWMKMQRRWGEGQRVTSASEGAARWLWDRLRSTCAAPPGSRRILQGFVIEQGFRLGRRTR